MQELSAGSLSSIAVGDDRKRLVLDLCVLCRLFGAGAVDRDDDRHRLADISDFVAGERILGARQQRRHADQNRNGWRLLPSVGESEGVDDAGGRLDRGEVDPLDAGMAVRAADQRCVQYARQAYVIDVAALAAQ